MNKTKEKILRVTLIKSLIAEKPDHKKCAIGLGLGQKMHKTVLVPDTACHRGMINKISHLLLVEKA